MSLSLVEALGQVDLVMGQVYHCQVNGKHVELRVLNPQDEPTASMLDESDIMLDAWVELPRPPIVATVQSHYAPPPPIHVPEIPRDEAD